MTAVGAVVAPAVARIAVLSRHLAIWMIERRKESGKSRIKRPKRVRKSESTRRSRPRKRNRKSTANNIVAVLIYIDLFDFCFIY